MFLLLASASIVFFIASISAICAVLKSPASLARDIFYAGCTRKAEARPLSYRHALCLNCQAQLVSRDVEQRRRWPTLGVSSSFQSSRSAFSAYWGKTQRSSEHAEKRRRWRSRHIRWPTLGVSTSCQSWPSTFSVSWSTTQRSRRHAEKRRRWRFRHIETRCPWHARSRPLFAQGFRTNPMGNQSKVSLEPQLASCVNYMCGAIRLLKERRKCDTVC